MKTAKIDHFCSIWLIEGLDLQKTGNFALLRERGSKGNEKLDVQGAIFLKGSICSDIAANKCIACALARKKKTKKGKL